MDGAVVIIDADGHYLDGDPRALEILGVTLDELRSASSETFASEPADPSQAAAFRTAWEDAGRPDITGETTARRPDGTRVRIRFAISPRADGTYTAFFEPVAGAVSQPATVRTVGAVLTAWRAAERRLESLELGTPEWHEAIGEVEWLRQAYAAAFDERHAEDPVASGDPSPSGR